MPLDSTQLADSTAAYGAALQDVPPIIDQSDLGFFQQTFYMNTVQEWAITLGIIVGSAIVAKILYWAIGKYVKKVTAKTKTQLDDLLVDKLEEPVVYALVIGGIFYGLERLAMTPGMESFILTAFTFAFTLNITWLFVRTIDALIEEYIVPLTAKSDSDLDDQLLPILRKAVRVVLWSLGFITGLNNAGFDVAALIAGLGIGGLALALAAQDTVKNIFGGLMVFLDKPFKMNQRIKLNGIDGTVEEIGIRSTRIRTLEGRLVTIPNGQFSDNAVENVTVEPNRKVVINLGLTYETAPEKMEEALATLKDIINNNDNTEETVLVSFNSWGDFSMGILLIFYIKPTSDILETHTEINMEILKRFNAAGLDFAYPTQMLYHKPVN